MINYIEPPEQMNIDNILYAYLRENYPIFYNKIPEQIGFFLWDGCQKIIRASLHKYNHKDIK